MEFGTIWKFKSKVSRSNSEHFELYFLPTHRRLCSSAGRSNFMSLSYFFWFASCTKLTFITWFRNLEGGQTGTWQIYSHKDEGSMERSDLTRCSLVNGPKQPFWFFVERHIHVVKMGQTGGDLHWDNGIWELLCAQAGTLRRQSRLSLLLHYRESEDFTAHWGMKHGIGNQIVLSRTNEKNVTLYLNQEVNANHWHVLVPHLI